VARLIASEEGHDARTVEEAQLAGLLHDIGEVVLFQNWRDDYMKIDPSRRDRDEIDSFGATHAAISAYLCSSWNLSENVVDAARLHHAPSRQSAGGLTVTTAVHVARGLVDAGMDAAEAALDFEYLEELDLVDRIPVWAERAGKSAP
jgi:HD-like signal output (HDOD) protein